jgi:hypothetical protein
VGGEGAALATMTQLPLILVAAVLQGWALYGLHHALEQHHWPATSSASTFALYAIALFVPATFELLAEYARAKMLWIAVGVLAVLYFYFGWDFGAHVAGDSFTKQQPNFGYAELALVLGVLWLHVLPFLQCRLLTGRWMPQYPVLFASAWRNALVLAEAGVFTGLFWLLLLLWHTLFHMLGIDFFRELFAKPIFIYPVTSLTFGCAVHLIGSVEKMTSTVLEQILSLLKWLAVIAGVILAFFTIALLFNLPNLVFTGHNAVGAAWLLWLVAVMVLFLNAAYRDGTVAKAYPDWIALPLRFITPLLIVISATALYALYVRTRNFGLTVDRVWAFVVAAGAMLYAVGYALAALRRGSWFGGIARVNIGIALALIAIIVLALTPVLSPYRLSADSQFHRVQRVGLPGSASVSGGIRFDSPLHYLRFSAGHYGVERLEQLAQGAAGADAAIVRSAAAMLANQSAWDSKANTTDIAARLGSLPIYPAGHQLGQALTATLLADLDKPERRFLLNPTSNIVAGLFVDLNGDATDEFVLLLAHQAFAYEQRDGAWVLLGTMLGGRLPGARTDNGTADLINDIQQGRISISPPKWSDLLIGGRRYRLTQ